MPLVTYILQQDFGDSKSGSQITMEQDEAQPYVDAGLLAEATSDDVNGEEEEETPMDAPEQEASISKTLRNEFQKLQAALVKKEKAALSSKANLPSIGNFAQPRQPVFKSMGEQCRAIYFARKGKAKYQNMLNAYEQEIRQKSPLGINEATDSQGGFAVQPEWTSEIWDKARDYPRLYDMTEKHPVSGNTLYSVGISENSLADGSRHGGVRAYWISNEGDTLTASQPALQRTPLLLNTQAALAYISNQELEDISYPLDSYLQKMVGLEFVYQENQSVTQGPGSGQPLGILNANALITVTHSTHTGSASVGYDDLTNMYQRMYGPSKNKAVWIVTPAIYSTLLQMQFPYNGAGTNIPAFGAFSFNAHEEFPMRIFGRPVIEWWGMPQLGTVGDIIFADLSQLITGEKPTMHVDVSDQIQFVTYQTAFRFVRRYTIASNWQSALTSAGTTYSPFVALSARGT